MKGYLFFSILSRKYKDDEYEKVYMAAHSIADGGMWQ